MARFKAQELVLQTGGALVLNNDGSIDYLDEDGEFGDSWSVDDPEWETHAKLFRLPVEPEEAPAVGTAPSDAAIQEEPDAQIAV